MLAGIWTYVRRHHLAMLALFIAFGGTAWAIEANSVRSKHIVDEQVKDRDLSASVLRPLATARVNFDGTVSDAQNITDADITHVPSATFNPYCIDFDGAQHIEVTPLRGKTGGITQAVGFFQVVTPALVAEGAASDQFGGDEPCQESDEFYVSFFESDSTPHDGAWFTLVLY